MLTKINSPTPPPRSVSDLIEETGDLVADSLTTISSLVRLRAARQNPADDAKTFLMEMADRINTIAKLNRLVAQSNTGTVRLDKYLREICEWLAGVRASDGILLSVACSPEHVVPFTVALPLGLITAELFSNSLKYAHPSGLPVKITLSCGLSAENGMRLVYEDDGVGFSEGFDIAEDGHLGMHFIRLLCEQLKGTHEWLSDPLGVRFDLSMPK